MKHRMYIDEVGNSDLGASQDPNHRYLSLTGVVFDLAYVGAGSGYHKKTAPKGCEGLCLPPPEDWINRTIHGGD